MPPSKNGIAQVIIVFLLGWTFFFTIFMKEQGLFDSFFHLVDTLSEDIVMGGGPGLICVGIFAFCLLFGRFFAQYLTQRDFFVYLEKYISAEESLWHALKKPLAFPYEEEEKTYFYPQSTLGILFSFMWIYFLAMLNVFLFSQPVLFASMQESEVAGIILFSLVPMLSFRALTLCGIRGMDVFANGVVFLFLCIALMDIASLVGILPEIFSLYPKDILIQKSYMYHMILYSFIPVLLEGLTWLVLIFSSEDEQK